VISVLVTFSYDAADFDRERIEKIADEARGRFEGMPGLRFKAFTVDDEHHRAVNFYLWDDEDAARAFFSPELAEMISGLYGTAPSIVFLDVATVVDNAAS
jgi:hypothetical protein